MGGSVSHKYKCNTVCFCFVKSFISRCFYRFGSYSLCNIFLILIDGGSIFSYLTEKRFCYSDRLKLVTILIHSFHKLIVLCTMHKMGRLDQKVFHVICYGTV